MIGPAWLYHPLGLCPTHPTWQKVACESYNFWSGIEADLPELAMLATLLLALWRVRKLLHHHFECHEESCRRLGFHHVQGTNFWTCWGHHPILSAHPHRSVPLHHIHRSHRSAMGGATRVKEGNG